MAKERPVLTVNQWLASVPADRKAAIDAVRRTVNENLPNGYVETTDWGMLAWVVPFSTLPETHNGRPLLFAALSAHNKLMTVYLMSVWEDSRLRKEFETAYRKTGKTLNMGGCCIHFKTLDDLPLDVVGDAVTRVSVDQYIGIYEKSRAKVKTKPKTAKKATATKAKSKAKSKSNAKSKR